MSADNHWGQEAKSLPKQAGYMTAMISSQIDDQMSCKRGGSIYGASAENCLQQIRPRQLRCSSVGHDCSRQSFATPAVPGGRIQQSILPPRALLARRSNTLVVAYFILTRALSIPDFIANAGGVICAAVEYHGGTRTQAFQTIEQTVSDNIERLLRDLPGTDHVPRDVATWIARERVERATNFRR